MFHSDNSLVGSSYLSKRARLNPREIITSLIEANKSASKEHLFELFRKEISGDNEYQRAIDWYFFINMYSYSQRPPRPSRSSLVEDEKLKQIAKQAAATILLLNLEMPNGKRLRFCTGNYVAATCAALAKAGKKAGSKMMGQVFDEKSLREYIG